MLAAITALKQICNHPAAYTGDDEPLAGRSGSAAEWAGAAVLPVAALTVLATATLAVPSWP